MVYVTLTPTLFAGLLLATVPANTTLASLEDVVMAAGFSYRQSLLSELALAPVPSKNWI
jgi:hypothetical protein